MNTVAQEPVANPLFTGGQVAMQSIIHRGDGDDFNLLIVHFSAGSRSKFHIHSSDQVLVITEGAGKVATDDEVVKVTPGDVVLIPAGENHWHGAPDDTAMAHITLTRKGMQTTQTEPYPPLHRWRQPTSASYPLIPPGPDAI